MELIPFWEPSNGKVLTEKLWFVISNPTDVPGMRTGHASIILESSFIITGGANPDGTFSDLCEYNFVLNQWKRFNIKNFVGRYEHSLFKSPKYPCTLLLFGGCTEQGNCNEVFSISLKMPLEAKLVKTIGSKPAPRTFNCTSSFDDAKFYVFGGGLETSKAIKDPFVYCLDLETMCWKKLENKGATPSPRQGHSLSLVKNLLVCFGGMNAGEFYSDLFVYNLDMETWQKIKTKGSIPCARAAHASCVLGEKVIINGGLCLDTGGCLQDIYILNITNFKWQLVNVQHPLPGCRLGHSIVPVPDYCLTCYSPDACTNQGDVDTSHPSPGHEASADHSDSSRIIDVTENFLPKNNNTASTSDESEYNTVAPLQCMDLSKEKRSQDTETNKFIVFGGLDTNGIIFDDILLIKLL